MLSIGSEQFAPRNSVGPTCMLCSSGSQGRRNSDGNKNADCTSQARVMQLRPLPARSSATGVPTLIVLPLSMCRQALPAQHRRAGKAGVQWLMRGGTLFGYATRVPPTRKTPSAEASMRNAAGCRQCHKSSATPRTRSALSAGNNRGP